MTLPTLYKKSSQGKIEQWEVYVSQKMDGRYHVNSTYGEVDGKMQTTFDTITEGKNIGKANETTVYQQACNEAAAKWEKKKKKGYVESKEAALAGELDDLIEGGIEPMLAHVYEKHADKLVFPCLAQPKLDGIRCIAIKKGDSVTLWSRSRKRITSCPHIEKEIAFSLAHVQDIVLDGELFHPSANLKPFEVFEIDGKQVFIDLEDVNKLQGYAIRISKDGYPVVSIERKSEYIHRLVMNFPDGNIDHKNRNKLDARKANLRVCSMSENLANTTKRITNTSGFKGVMFFKRDSKWQAQITKDYKKIHIGYFDTAEAAAIAYDQKAKQLFGDFALLNFPEAKITNFEDIVSAVRKEKPSPESAKIQYHVYDMIDANLTNLQRVRWINMHLLFSDNGPIRLVKTEIIRTEADISTIFKEHRNAGYEGTMLRNSAAKYEHKRSHNLLKVKMFDDAEFEIIGVVEGKGKLQGLLGAFLCRTQEGAEFEVKMTGNQEETRKFLNDHTLWKGKMLTVQYQGLTGKNKVPRFPVGLRIREVGL